MRARELNSRWPRCAAVAALATAPLGLLLSGCADDTYASAEGKSPPYILKEGCKFTIVGENGKAGVTSPEATGVSNDAVSMSISLGDFTIAVSDCELVENSHGLPVYED